MKILFLGYQDNSIVEFYRAANYDLHVTDVRLTAEEISQIDPDWIISYGYRHIIKKPVIDRYRNRIINLHISFLPWNRGVSPNLWSFLTDTKKGVTIHILDEGIDTGDILFQQEVFFDKEVTLGESYQLLRNEIEKLFIKNWSNIRDNKHTPMKQDLNDGTYHTQKETRAMVRQLGINDWDITCRDLIDMKNKTDQQIIDEIQQIRQANNTHWMDVVRLAFRLAPEEARRIFKDIKQCDKNINVLLDELADNDKGRSPPEGT